jgi:hypothetical protein
MLQLTLGNRITCVWCGNSFRLQRRAQRFCSPKCQKTGRRAEMAAGAMRSRTSSTTSPVGGFCPKNVSVVRDVQGRGVRSSPLLRAPANILGGHQWADTPPIEQATIGAIIRAEIGGEFFDASTFAEAAE